MTELDIVNNRFDEVENLSLRTYNRLVLATNLQEDAGSVIAKQYLEQFTPSEKKQIAFMSVLINKVGIDKVRELVQKSVEGDANDLPTSA